MRDQYLLYIDILGFTDLVTQSPERVEEVYRVIASLHAHDHPDFATIVFSDTVLVHCAAELRTKHDHEYVVMYLCEFAQDLLDRLVGRDIAFRAVLTYGAFDHYRLNDVPCFFGPALIKAHLAEKEIKATGLYIDTASNRHNRIFPSVPLNEEWSFVFVTQQLTEFEDTWRGSVPLPNILVHDADFGWFVGPEVVHLQEVFTKAQQHPVDSVRAKYRRTWEFYEQRYPRTVRSLMSADFQLEALSAHFDWAEVRRRIATEDYSWASVRRSVDPKP